MDGVEEPICVMLIEMRCVFCTNPVIMITLQAAIGVDGVEFWDEDDDLWVRNEAVLNDRPSSSSSSLLLGDC